VCSTIAIHFRYDRKWISKTKLPIAFLSQILNPRTRNAEMLLLRRMSCFVALRKSSFENVIHECHFGMSHGLVNPSIAWKENILVRLQNRQQ
jgi:hypothetical protein